MHGLVVLHKFDDIGGKIEVKIRKADRVAEATEQRKFQEHSLVRSSSEFAFYSARPFELGFGDCKHVELIFENHTSVVKEVHGDAPLKRCGLYWGPKVSLSLSM